MNCIIFTLLFTSIFLYSWVEGLEFVGAILFASFYGSICWMFQGEPLEEEYEMPEMTGWMWITSIILVVCLILSWTEMTIFLYWMSLTFFWVGIRNQWFMIWWWGLGLFLLNTWIFSYSLITGGEIAKELVW